MVMLVLRNDTACYISIHCRNLVIHIFEQTNTAPWGRWSSLRLQRRCGQTEQGGLSHLSCCCSLSKRINLRMDLSPLEVFCSKAGAWEQAVALGDFPQEATYLVWSPQEERRGEEQKGQDRHKTSSSWGLAWYLEKYTSPPDRQTAAAESAHQH